jgi:hypothetical protein
MQLILTRHDEIDIWIEAPLLIALLLQRPLVDDGWWWWPAVQSRTVDRCSYWRPGFRSSFVRMVLRQFVFGDAVRTPYIEDMQIYLFASETHAAVKALTSDQTGGNLPADYAPWRSVDNGREAPIGSKVDPATKAVLRDGFLLLSGKSARSAE